MTKYYLLIKGNVTDVGFRVFAKKIAVFLGIDGYVRNLNSDVQIFCNIKNTKTVEEFERRLKSSNVKDPEKDLSGVYVTEIKTYKEGDKGFKEGEHPITKGFFLEHELLPDDQIRPFEKQSLSRLDAGTFILQTKFNYMDGKYDKMSSALDSLAIFFKAYSAFTGALLLFVLIILAILVLR